MPWATPTYAASATPTADGTPSQRAECSEPSGRGRTSMTRACTARRSTAGTARLSQLHLRADPANKVVRLDHQALPVVVQGHFMRGVGQRQQALVRRAEVLKDVRSIGLVHDLVGVAVDQQRGAAHLVEPCTD